MKFLITLFVLTWSIGAFSQENAQDRTEGLSTLKANLESILNNEPYKTDEHTTIKAYFVELGSLVKDLQMSSRYRKRFNRFLRSTGVEVFCQKAYLDQKQWDELIGNCTMNDFFLCTEEVKLYSENKVAMKELVDTDNKTQLETLPACQ